MPQCRICKAIYIYESALVLGVRTFVTCECTSDVYVTALVQWYVEPTCPVVVLVTTLDRKAWTVGSTTVGWSVIIETMVGLSLSLTDLCWVVDSMHCDHSDHSKTCRDQQLDPMLWCARWNHHLVYWDYSLGWIVGFRTLG